MSSPASTSSYQEREHHEPHHDSESPTAPRTMPTHWSTDTSLDTRPQRPMTVQDTVKDAVDMYLMRVLYMLSAVVILAEVAAKRLSKSLGLDPWVERVRGRIHHYIVPGSDPPLSSVSSYASYDTPDLERGLLEPADRVVFSTEHFESLSSSGSPAAVSQVSETTPLLLNSQTASLSIPSSARRSSVSSSHPSLLTIRARTSLPDDENENDSSSTEIKQVEDHDDHAFDYDEVERPISATSSTSSFLSPPPSYDSHPSSSSSSIIILRSALKKPSHPSTSLVSSSNASFVDGDGPSTVMRKSVRFNERENQTRIVEYTLAEREEKRSGKPGSGSGSRWLKDGKSRAWQDSRSGSSREGSPLRLSRRELDALDTETEAALIFGDSWMGKLLHSAFLSLRASAQSAGGAGMRGAGGGGGGQHGAMMGFASDMNEDRWRDGAF